MPIVIVGGASLRVKKTESLLLGLVLESGGLLRKYEVGNRCFYAPEVLGPRATSIVVDATINGWRFAKRTVNDLAAGGLLYQVDGISSLDIPGVVTSREALDLTDRGREIAEACRAHWEPEWEDFFTSRGYRAGLRSLLRGHGLR